MIATLAALPLVLIFQKPSTSNGTGHVVAME
jgi:hypothetical protein